MGQKFAVTPSIAERRKVVYLGGESEEWVHIGRLAELGPSRQVYLGLDHEHVLAIVGKRGSGKSFTLGTLLEGFCTRDGSTSIASTSKKRSVLLFDTLNIFQWMGSVVPTTDQGQSGTPESLAQQAKLLREWHLETVALDVDLWAPAGFEPAGTVNASAFRIRTWDMEAQDWAALLGVDLVQDIMGQLIAALLDKVTRRGWDDGHGSFTASIERYEISDLLDCLSRDPDLANDYTPASLRAVRQRLNAYDATPLFGNDGTSLTDLLRPGRLSVLLLSGVPDDIRLVVIYLTLRKLLASRARASEASKALLLGTVGQDERPRLQAEVDAAPPKTWVVIDEAQNIFPSERQTTASDTLLRFVREGRNFGLSLAFTTQQPTALDQRVMAQVDTVIAHTLTVQRDINAVLTSLKTVAPQTIKLKGIPVGTPDAIRLLGTGQAFVSSVDTERSLFMDVRPRVSVHGGFEH